MNRRAGGFTLIEIMVALGIMAIGVTSALSLFAGATALHKRALDKMNSAFMADTVLSEVGDRLMTSTAADLGNSSAGVVPGFPGYEYKVTYTPLDDADQEWFLECEITWNVKGIKQIEKFQTIQIKHVSYKERNEPLIRPEERN